MSWRLGGGGLPKLRCLCGAAIRGKGHGSGWLPGGAFVSNHLKADLAHGSSVDFSSGLRPCGPDGNFKSLALIPLHHGKKSLGLIQLADSEPGRLPGQLAQIAGRLGRVCGRIIARYQQEAKWDRREAYFQTLVDNSSEGLFILDADGCLLYANPGLGRVLGHSAEKLQGRQLALLMHPEDTAALKDALRRGLTSSGALRPFQCRLRHQNGGYRTVEAEGKVLLADPLVQGILISCRDITQSQCDLKALAASEERHRSMLEKAPEGVWLLDGQGRTTWTNQALRDLLGAESVELKGRLLTDFVDPANLPACQTALEPGQDRAARCLELTLQGPGGAGMLAQVSLGPLPGGETMAMVTDLSQSHALQERNQREDTLESLSGMAGHLAHKFNNLLMAILGIAELAAEASPPGSVLAGDLDEITGAAQRAAELTGSLLAYTGRGPRHLARVDLSGLADNLSLHLKALLPAGASLQLELAPGLPALRADADLLGLALESLVQNAADSLGTEGGVITIATGSQDCSRAFLDRAWLGPDTPEGDYAWLEVRDDGAGMDAHVLLHLFDPFFSTKRNGRGMGLAVALGVMRAHRGAALVQSTPGQGSALRLLFPLASIAKRQEAKV